MTLPNVERLKTALLKFGNCPVRLDVLAKDADMTIGKTSRMLRPFVKRGVVKRVMRWDGRAMRAFYRTCGNLDES